MRLLSATMVILLALAMETVFWNVLQLIRAELGYPPALNNWDPLTDPCIGWVGITCINGVVAVLNLLGIPSEPATAAFPPSIGLLPGLTSLQLGGTTTLTGSLPSEWSSLSSLASLELMDSGAEGPLPPSWSLLTSLTSFQATGNSNLDGPMPSEWSSLANLVTLDLSSNALSGALPPSWSSLSGLRKLDLSSNSLTGPLPPSWSALDGLMALNASDNSLTGPLPSTWASLPQLLELDLSRNELNSTLPASWSLLTQLQVMNLSHNSLTGYIPSAWSELLQIRDMDLSHNNFTGTLPNAWSVLTQLQSLDLSYNSLTGSLPLAWSELPKIQDMDLSHNNFNGTLPSSWSTLTRLSTLDNLASLDVSHNSLTGTLPPSWSSLTHLEVLHLSYNSLTGTLPAEWSEISSLEKLEIKNVQLHGPLPPSWGNLTNLVDLDISGNSFTGTRPSSWSALTQLTALDFSNNNLTGPLPSSWGALSSLQYLNASYNAFDGSLPLAWTSLVDLTSLDLSSNELTGSLPPSWSSLTNLVHLNISHNTLTSTLPPTWNALTKLEYLDLSTNQLTASLPEAWSTLDQLIVLDLSDNLITGPAPSFWNAMTSLQSLNLSSNSITSSLPSSWSTLTNLQELDLSSNSITSSLPSSWSTLTDLQKLELSSNSITGSLDASWDALTSLVSLKMSYNSLTASLPPSWSSLTLLTELDLSYNNLDGSLPPEWDSLTNLVILNMSHNQLSSSLPPWTSLVNLEALDLSYNSITGPVPAAWSTLTALTMLDLSHNNLTGTLPSWDGLTALNYLDLSGNGLVGSLPDSWSTHTQLQYLNLSHNTFTDTLPDAWTTLVNLDTMDVSSNQLSGVLPPSWYQLTSLSSLSLANNALTSSLPPWWGSMTNLQVLSLSGNNLTSSLPFEWGNLIGLSQLSLSGNQLTSTTPAEWTSLLRLVTLDVSNNPKLCGYIPDPLSPAVNYTGTRLENECPAAECLYAHGMTTEAPDETGQGTFQVSLYMREEDLSFCQKCGCTIDQESLPPGVFIVATSVPNFIENSGNGSGYVIRWIVSAEAYGVINLVFSLGTDTLLEKVIVSSNPPETECSYVHGMTTEAPDETGQGTFQVSLYMREEDLSFCQKCGCTIDQESLPPGVSIVATSVPNFIENSGNGSGYVIRWIVSAEAYGVINLVFSLGTDTLLEKVIVSSNPPETECSYVHGMTTEAPDETGQGTFQVSLYMREEDLSFCQKCGCTIDPEFLPPGVFIVATSGPNFIENSGNGSGHVIRWIVSAEAYGVINLVFSLGTDTLLEKVIVSSTPPETECSYAHGMTTEAPDETGQGTFQVSLYMREEDLSFCQKCGCTIDQESLPPGVSIVATSGPYFIENSGNGSGYVIRWIVSAEAYGVINLVFSLGTDTLLEKVIVSGNPPEAGCSSAPGMTTEAPDETGQDTFQVSLYMREEDLSWCQKCGCTIDPEFLPPGVSIVATSEPDFIERTGNGSGYVIRWILSADKDGVINTVFSLGTDTLLETVIVSTERPEAEGTISLREAPDGWDQPFRFLDIVLVFSVPVRGLTKDGIVCENAEIKSMTSENNMNQIFNVVAVGDVGSTSTFLLPASGYRNRLGLAGANDVRLYTDVPPNNGNGGSDIAATAISAGLGAMFLASIGGGAFLAAVIGNVRLMQSSYHVQLLAQSASLSSPGISDSYRDVANKFKWSMMGVKDTVPLFKGGYALEEDKEPTPPSPLPLLDATLPNPEPIPDREPVPDSESPSEETPIFPPPQLPLDLPQTPYRAAYPLPPPPSYPSPTVRSLARPAVPFLPPTLHPPPYFPNDDSRSPTRKMLESILDFVDGNLAERLPRMTLENAWYMSLELPDLEQAAMSRSLQEESGGEDRYSNQDLLYTLVISGLLLGAGVIIHVIVIWIYKRSVSSELHPYLWFPRYEVVLGGLLLVTITFFAALDIGRGSSHDAVSFIVLMTLPLPYALFIWWLALYRIWVSPVIHPNEQEREEVKEGKEVKEVLEEKEVDSKTMPFERPFSECWPLVVDASDTRAEKKDDGKKQDEETECLPLAIDTRDAMSEKKDDGENPYEDKSDSDEHYDDNDEDSDGEMEGPHWHQLQGPLLPLKPVDKGASIFFPNQANRESLHAVQAGLLDPVRTSDNNRTSDNERPSISRIIICADTSEGSKESGQLSRVRSLFASNAGGASGRLGGISSALLSSPSSKHRDTPNPAMYNNSLSSRIQDSVALSHNTSMISRVQSSAAMSHNHSMTSRVQGLDESLTTEASPEADRMSLQAPSPGLRDPNTRSQLWSYSESGAGAPNLGRGMSHAGSGRAVQAARHIPAAVGSNFQWGSAARGSAITTFSEGTESTRGSSIITASKSRDVSFLAEDKALVRMDGPFQEPAVEEKGPYGPGGQPSKAFCPKQQASWFDSSRTGGDAFSMHESEIEQLGPAALWMKQQEEKQQGFRPHAGSTRGSAITTGSKLRDLPIMYEDNDLEGMEGPSQEPAVEEEGPYGPAGQLSKVVHPKQQVGWFASSRTGSDAFSMHESTIEKLDPVALWMKRQEEKQQQQQQGFNPQTEGHFSNLDYLFNGAIGSFKAGKNVGSASARSASNPGGGRALGESVESAERSALGGRPLGESDESNGRMAPSSWITRIGQAVGVASSRLGGGRALGESAESVESVGRGATGGRPLGEGVESDDLDATISWVNPMSQGRQRVGLSRLPPGPLAEASDPGLIIMPARARSSSGALETAGDDGGYNLARWKPMHDARGYTSTPPSPRHTSGSPVLGDDKEGCISPKWKRIGDSRSYLASPLSPHHPSGNSTHGGDGDGHAPSRWKPMEGGRRTSSSPLSSVYPLGASTLPSLDRYPRSKSRAGTPLPCASSTGDRTKSSGSSSAATSPTNIASNSPGLFCKVPAISSSGTSSPRVFCQVPASSSTTDDTDHHSSKDIDHNGISIEAGKGKQGNALPTTSSSPGSDRDSDSKGELSKEELMAARAERVPAWMRRGAPSPNLLARFEFIFEDEVAEGTYDRNREQWWRLIAFPLNFTHKILCAACVGSTATQLDNLGQLVGICLLQIFMLVYVCAARPYWEWQLQWLEMYAHAAHTCISTTALSLRYVGKNSGANVFMLAAAKAQAAAKACEIQSQIAELAQNHADNLKKNLDEDIRKFDKEKAEMNLTEPADTEEELERGVHSTEEVAKLQAKAQKTVDEVTEAAEKAAKAAQVAEAEAAKARHALEQAKAAQFKAYEQVPPIKTGDKKPEVENDRKDADAFVKEAEEACAQGAAAAAAASIAAEKAKVAVKQATRQQTEVANRVEAAHKKEESVMKKLKKELNKKTLSDTLKSTMAKVTETHIVKLRNHVRAKYEEQAILCEAAQLSAEEERTTRKAADVAAKPLPSYMRSTKAISGMQKSPEAVAQAEQKAVEAKEQAGTANLAADSAVLAHRLLFWSWTIC
eukprot:gene26789-4377_t